MLLQKKWEALLFSVNGAKTIEYSTSKRNLDNTLYCTHTPPWSRELSYTGKAPEKVNFHTSERQTVGQSMVEEQSFDRMKNEGEREPKRWKKTGKCIM